MNGASQTRKKLAKWKEKWALQFLSYHPPHCPVTISNAQESKIMLTRVSTGTKHPQCMSTSMSPTFLPALAPLRSTTQTLNRLKIERLGVKLNTGHKKATKRVLPVQQTVKLRYVRAVDYRTFRLNDRSPQYDYSVSPYVPKIVKKLRS